jgi:hypothetical protein
VDTQILIEQGEVIGYAAVGAIALIGFVVVHLFRRRGDRKKAMTAVRLASLSLNDPRPGPAAIRGTYRRDTIECGGQQVTPEGTIEIVRGSKARWSRGVRTYSLGDGETVIAIGVMTKKGAGWSLAASPGESGVLLYAEKPVAAPPPLFPFRALLFLAITGSIGFFGLYGVGTLLLDVPRGSDIDPCRESAITRFELATAVPQLGIRDQALDELARCASAQSAPPPAPR